MEEMTREERQEYEEEETTKDDMGATLIVIGAIFLMYDLVLTLFVGWDVRAGSSFFVTWEVVQTVLAITLIVVGSVKKIKAHVKDNV